MRLPTGLLVAIAFVQLSVGPASTQVTGPPALVGIGEHDIGGVVKSANGPEGGVWVIAETTDLRTRFARIVVTDDAGRFVIPDLPEARYRLWVRGYGLVDSPKVREASVSISTR